MSPHCGHVAWFRLVLVSHSLYIPFGVYIMRIVIFLILFGYRHLKTYLFFYIIQVCVSSCSNLYSQARLDGVHPNDGFCTYRIFSSCDIHQVSICYFCGNFGIGQVRALTPLLLILCIDTTHQLIYWSNIGLDAADTYITSCQWSGTSAQPRI